MSRPKNKDEYRAELADTFAHVLEEKGLEWQKEWRGSGGSAPQNGITKACYRGCNAFWLSLISMMKGYDDGWPWCRSWIRTANTTPSKTGT